MDLDGNPGGQNVRSRVGRAGRDLAGWFAAKRRVSPKSGLYFRKSRGTGHFTQAQTEYLRGNWFEAEALVREMLERDPSDVEAHVLWIALLRRIDHVDEALDCVRHVRTLTGSGRWALELAREEQTPERAASDRRRDDRACRFGDPDVAETGRLGVVSSRGRGCPAVLADCDAAHEMR
ncbi:MAG: hypothetical protein QM811_29995 [Pirellulales bacterium]